MEFAGSFHVFVQRPRIDQLLLEEFILHNLESDVFIVDSETGKAKQGRKGRSRDGETEGQAINHVHGVQGHPVFPTPFNHAWMLLVLRMSSSEAQTVEAASLDYVTLQLSGMSFHHEGYDQHAHHGNQNERMEYRNHIWLAFHLVFDLDFHFESHRVGISKSFSSRSKPDVSQKKSPLIDEVISNDLEGL